MFFFRIMIEEAESLIYNFSSELTTPDVFHEYTASHSGLPIVIDNGKVNLRLYHELFKNNF